MAASILSTRAKVAFLLMALVVACSSDGREETRETVAEFESQPGIAVGAWVPRIPWDLSELDAHEQAVGRSNTIVNMFWSWDEASHGPDPALIARISKRGSTPMITWMPQDYRRGADQPDFSLQQILSGRYDSYIKKWAQALASLEEPVLLRFAHEMNGYWYAWGDGVNGNTPEQFVATWRHVHDIFTKNGATNVRWVWAPNIDFADPAAFFPGDAYVDWLGLTGFNNALWGRWRSFTELFAGTYARITVLSDRPVMIAEVASSEGNAHVGGDKAEWIRSMYSREIPESFPRIKAVVWFDEDKGPEGDYRIASSAAALSAYREAVSSPIFSRSLEQGR